MNLFILPTALKRGEILIINSGTDWCQGSAIDSRSAGGARAPPEFGGSERVESQISAYRSLAITKTPLDLKSYLWHCKVYV